MSDTLFDAADLYVGDPIAPGTSEDDDFTPVEIVAALSRNDRARRVRHLTAAAEAIVEDAVARHADGRAVTARAVAEGKSGFIATGRDGGFAPIEDAQP